jgi:hypothetical protein
MTSGKTSHSLENFTLSMESIQAWQWRTQGVRTGGRDRIRTMNQSNQASASDDGEVVVASERSKTAIQQEAGELEDQRLQTSAHFPSKVVADYLANRIHSPNTAQ